MKTRTGGCLCGSVRYTVRGEPLRTMICHCKICQRSSGSAISTIAIFPRDSLNVEGELRAYEYAGDSGRKLAINFCPNCGAPVLLDIRAMPDLVSIKVGSLDDTSWFDPTVDIWTDSAQSWFPTTGDRRRFPENPS